MPATALVPAGFHVFRVWFWPRSCGPLGHQRVRRQAIHHRRRRTPRQARPCAIECRLCRKSERHDPSRSVILGGPQTFLEGRLPRAGRCARDRHRERHDRLRPLRRDSRTYPARRHFRHIEGNSRYPAARRRRHHADRLRGSFKGFDPSISSFNFLTYSDEQWEPFQSRFQYVNRLRHSQYLDLFKNAGFEIVLANPDRRPAEPAILSQLASRFHGFTEEDLFTLGALIVARPLDKTRTT